MNPLSAYISSDRVYVKLPTKGYFYNDNVISDADDEIGIRAMSARDEFEFNNAQALMNGKAVEHVIKNCVGSVKDPTSLSICDVEVLLLGLKLASGEKTYEYPTECPHCKKGGVIERDIDRLLTDIDLHKSEYPYNIGEVKLNLIPSTWKSFNKIHRSQYEQQKLIKMMLSPTFADSTEEYKQEQIDKAFNNIVELTYELILDSIEKATTPDGTVVQDRKFLKEFIDSLPSEVYHDLLEKINSINDCGVKKHEEIECDSCHEVFEVKIDRFDPTYFFARGSYTPSQKK